MQATEETKINPFDFVKNLAADLNKHELELPGFPDVVMQLHHCLADDNSTAKDIEKLITSEPALAARLIQISNSAAFNTRGREVGEVRSAVTLLGFNTVRSTATTFAMRQMEQQEWLKAVKPQLEKIWKSSNAVAAVCYAVGQRIGEVQADEALATGLFHQMGALYLLSRGHKAGLDMNNDPSWDAMVDGWQPTITRAILENWSIPEHIGVAVEQQDTLFDPDADTREMTPLAKVLSAAKLYCTLENESDANVTREIEGVLESIMLPEKSFIDLVGSCQEQIQDIRSSMI